MTEYQKAALSVIQSVSLQLILVAVGAVAIVGSVLATRTTPTKSRRALYWGMGLLMLSVVCGVVGLGNAVSQLADKGFDPYEPILRWSYFLQLLWMIVGGTVFVWYLARNIR